MIQAAAVSRSQPRTEALIWLFAAAAHLLIWISLRTQWLCAFFNDAVHRSGPAADFFALYQAGHVALQGHSVYAIPDSLVVVPHFYPFRYLPGVAYTFGAAATALPPMLAYTAWIGVLEFCLLYNVRTTYHAAGQGVRGAALAGVWLAFFPFFLELWMGQFTFVLGSMLFWAVLSAPEEPGQGPSWRRAQGWWIASVLWKPASLLWIPIWLRQRRFWPGLLLMGVLLATNGLYFLQFPGDWKLFAENGGAVPDFHAGNVGLSSLIQCFARDGAPFLAIRAICTAAVLLPALWLTFRKRELPFWLLGAIWTTLYFLVYKDVWEHHLTLVLPFLVLGLWRAPSPLLIAVTVLLCLPSPFVLYDVQGSVPVIDPQRFFSPAVSLLHHSWRVVPIVALYGYWLWLAWRVKPMETASPAS